MVATRITSAPPPKTTTSAIFGVNQLGVLMRRALRRPRIACIACIAPALIDRAAWADAVAFFAGLMLAFGAAFAAGIALGSGALELVAGAGAGEVAGASFAAGGVAGLASASSRIAISRTLTSVARPRSTGQLG